MIINVTYGDAEGIGRYIQGSAKEHGRNVPGTEDRARIIEGKGFGFPIHTQDDVDLARDVMRKDLELQHSNTKQITNTGIHSSMSWPEGYQPTRDEMRQAVDGLAKAWDMEGARRVSWSHDDTKHRHLHTLWGAVNPDTGRAYHDHERNDRAQREAIRQEREYGPLPPSRQRDHDIAAAAEVSDHARTLELSKNTDGSISRRRLDRAFSLGGHFGPDKTAQRNEFINQTELTKFPRHRGQAYAPPEVASEKRDYISKNREPSSSLARAYNREAKERARGVAGLYEDHSFEKTSKPPVQGERKGSMGINDVLDWPWKKAGEFIRDKWQDRRDRKFEEKLKEKGGDMSHPEVRREWEKKYGPGSRRWREQQEQYDRNAEEWRKGKESRDRPRSPAEVIREMKIDEGRKGASTEHARLKNWEIQRERRAKEEGRAISGDNVPPWRKVEQHSAAYRRQKELEQEERDSKPLPETRLQKHWREQTAKPRPDHYVPLPGTDPQRQQQTPALPRPREVPMPKIEPHDHAPATNQQEPKSVNTPQHDPKQKDIEENWKRDLDKINKELGKEQAEREEQGRELPRSRGPEETRDDWVPPRLRKFHNQNDIARDQSRADGTAGQGRRDETQAGQPGILPGGSHEHGSPTKQFRDQLNESLRKIKIPEREVGKEQERER